MSVVPEYWWPSFHFHLQKSMNALLQGRRFTATAVTDMILWLVWVHSFYFGRSYCVDTPPSPFPPSLWKVTALMRGDRNGTWLLLLGGWSFPLPQWWRRLRLVLRSEVAPFFTPACICQAVIAPGGDSFQSRGRRILSSHMMLSLFFLSSARRGGEFAVRCWWESCLF